MMTELIIAKREHLSCVAALERETFASPWSESALELFLGEGGFCAALLEGDKLQSYCTVTTVLDEAQIINVATDKCCLRRGLARKTLEFVFEECKTRGITSISLEVRESNASAIALYETLGFESVGKRRNFYEKPREDALIMIKKLD